MKLKGTAYWAHLLKPTDNYAKTGKEYTVDIVLDAASEAAFKEEFGASKIKSATNTSGKLHASQSPYIVLSKPSQTKDGGAIPKPEVVDVYGNTWSADTPIGNGSKVSVIVGIREGTFNNKPWRKPSLLKVRVDEHVAFETEDFDDYEEDPNPAFEGGEDFD